MSRVKILRASAGSGKTYRLSFEYIKAVVEEPSAYGSILAVTFTNKATEEMKRRIVEQLDALSRGRSSYLNGLTEATGLDRDTVVRNAQRALGLILQDYSRFSISTIDRFFQRIVRGFLKELDLDFNYTVELERDGMLVEAVDRVIERSAHDAGLRDYLSRMTMERIENGGSWDIRGALVEMGRELFVEGYAQDERPVEQTVQVFRQIEQQVEERKEHLRQVCGRAMEMIAAAGLEPSDFKQGKNSFAQYFAKIYKGQGVVAKYSSYFARAAADEQECYTAKSPQREQIVALLPELMPLVRQVEAMYDALERDMRSVELLDRMFDRYLLLRHIAEELTAVWTEKGRIPIHQTNRLIGQIVQHSDPPFIYEKVGNRYSTYMIDEFQDTSIGQWRNFQPLLVEAVSRTQQQAVMLIGDVKQAIYRWRGGDWSLLASVAGDSFERDTVDGAENLSTNWRSEPRVVEFNNRLIRGVAEADRQVMDEFLGEPYGRSIALAYDGMEQRVPEGRSAEAGYVRVECYDPTDEDGGVESRMLSVVSDLLARGYAPGDVAVLVRSKAQGRQVAQMLLGAGYSVVSSEALRLAESEVVGFVVALLRLSVDATDGVQRAVVNRFLGRDYGQSLDPHTEELIRVMALRSPIEALEMVIERFALSEAQNLRGQVAYLQAFYQALQDYCAANVADVAGFLKWWDVASDTCSIPMPDARQSISIMTIHKSKGLEFACVVIPFADWSLLPESSGTRRTVLWVQSAQPPFDALPPLPAPYGADMRVSHFEQEYLLESMFSHIDAVNLLYVAVTRARSELYVMFEQPTQPKKGTAPARISNLIQAAIGDDAVFESGRRPEVALAAESKHEADGVMQINDFPTHYVAQRLKSRPTERFVEATNLRSARMTGVLLHSVLERVATLADAERLLQQMQQRGAVDRVQVTAMEQVIRQMEADPVIRDWFSERWEVLNERAIVIPGGDTLRPDRVLVDDEASQAVVVDYKFGVVKKAGYETQVADYAGLLRQMGYRSVVGYVWYVELGEVVEVKR